MNNGASLRYIAAPVETLAQVTQSRGIEPTPRDECALLPLRGLEFTASLENR
jgi:hypothetical protein